MDRRSPFGSILLLIVFSPLVSACTDSGGSACLDGWSCPVGTVCVEGRELCGAEIEVDACLGFDEGEDCGYGGVSGFCREGICSIGCGNAVIETPEVCDVEPPPGESCVQHGFDMGTPGCSSACDSVNTRTCQRFGWQRLDISDGRLLGRMSGTDPRNLFIAGAVGNTIEDLVACGLSRDCGRILHYDGVRWHEIITDSIFLTDIWASDDGVVFAVGPFGTILRSTDLVEWSRMAAPDEHHFMAIWGSAADNVFAVTFTGEIMRYDGRSWTPMKLPDGLHSLLDLDGTGPDNIFAVGRNGSILHYDGSEEGSWRLMSTPVDAHFTSIAATSEAHIVVVGTDATILQYNDNNRQPWDLVQTDNADIAYATVSATGPGTFVIAGEGGPLIRYDSITGEATGSEEWMSNDRFIGSWSDGHGSAWLVGLDSAWRHIPDDGWSTENVEEELAIRGIWGSSSSNIFAVSDSGSIMHSNGDPDKRWKKWQSESGEPIIDIWGNTRGDVFAVGNNGAILRRDAITGWRAMHNDNNNHLHGVWGTQQGVFAVGDHGTILFFDGNQHDRWTPMKSGTDENLVDVSGSGSDHVFAVGENAEILYYDGNPQHRWTTAIGWTTELPGRAEAVWVADSGNAFIAGELGRVLIYEHASRSWRWSETGATKSWKAIWGNSPADIYVTGDDGFIFHYDGRDWSQVRGNHAANQLAIWAFPRSDMTLFGDSRGRIHRLTLSADRLTTVAPGAGKRSPAIRNACQGTDSSCREIAQ